MQTIEAMRAMIDQSGLTHRQIAHRLGKYDAYVSQVVSRARDPQASTLADIARACGYRLELVPMDGGEAITIGEAMDDGTSAAAGDRFVQARALLHRAAALLDDMA